jgi:GNAT superfamily N-acetyltransferase
MKPPLVTPPTLAGERRDADQLHMQAYHGATKLVIDKYFNARYGQSQLSLAQLACHPSYSRRGAATKLLGWGLGLARELGKPVTLLAGPIAHRLYQRQGFLQVAMVTARVHGEKESVSFPGLVWDPKLREILQEQEWSEPCVPHENFVLGEEDSDGGIDTNA